MTGLAQGRAYRHVGLVDEGLCCVSGRELQPVPMPGPGGACVTRARSGRCMRSWPRTATTSSTCACRSPTRRRRRSATLRSCRRGCGVARRLCKRAGACACRLLHACTHAPLGWGRGHQELRRARRRGWGISRMLRKRARACAGMRTRAAEMGSWVTRESGAARAGAAGGPAGGRRAGVQLPDGPRADHHRHGHRGTAAAAPPHADRRRHAAGARAACAAPPRAALAGAMRAARALERAPARS
jgi:hypothetical protein